jgi:hypothetical protein
MTNERPKADGLFENLTKFTILAAQSAQKRRKKQKAKGTEFLNSKLWSLLFSF